MPSHTTDNVGDREIILTRVLNAPRSVVWRAWAEPEQLIKWWGPDGFTNTFQQFDMRPGGVWRFMMHGPDGTDYPNLIVYETIDEPNGMTLRHGEDDGTNVPVNPFHVTVTFEETSPKTTRLTMRMVMATAKDKQNAVGFGAVELGNQTLAKLDAHLSAM